MLGVSTLIAFAAAVLLVGAAITQWVLAIRSRVGGVTWWQASLLRRAQLTDRGAVHRRRCVRLFMAAVGMWFLAGLLGALALCCTPAGAAVEPCRSAELQWTPC